MAWLGVEGETFYHERKNEGEFSGDKIQYKRYWVGFLCGSVLRVGPDLGMFINSLVDSRSQTAVGIVSAAETAKASGTWEFGRV